VRVFQVDGEMTAERRQHRCCSYGCRPSCCWHWDHSRWNYQHWHGCRPKWHSLPIPVRGTGNWGLLPYGLYPLFPVFYSGADDIITTSTKDEQEVLYLHPVHTLS